MDQPRHADDRDGPPEIIGKRGQAEFAAHITDPNHIRASDPGQVEGNVVFTYLDAFDPDTEAVAELKADYRRGGLGDMVVKRRLTGILQTIVAPIRERRTKLCADPDTIMDILRAGAEKGRHVTERTKAEIVEGLGLFRL